MIYCIIASFNPGNSIGLGYSASLQSFEIFLFLISSCHFVVWSYGLISLVFGCYTCKLVVVIFWANIEAADRIDGVNEEDSKCEAFTTKDILWNFWSKTFG